MLDYTIILLFLFRCIDNSTWEAWENIPLDEAMVRLNLQNVIVGRKFAGERQTDWYSILVAFDSTELQYNLPAAV